VSLTSAAGTVWQISALGAAQALKQSTVIPSTSIRIREQSVALGDGLILVILQFL
jgi:hypothetical protein